MAKNNWTWESAVKALGTSVIMGAKVVYLQGKATLRLCSAADYLVKNYGFTVK